MLADIWDVAKTQGGNGEVFEQISFALWSVFVEAGVRGENVLKTELF